MLSPHVSFHVREVLRDASYQLWPGLGALVCCSGRHWAKLVPRAAFLSRVGSRGGGFLAGWPEMRESG